MARVRRWARRILLGLVATLALLVIAIVIMLHTDWGRDFVRRRVEVALARSFPGGARLGRLDGSVFGELVVHDLELDDLDHRPIVTVATARFRLALLPLVNSTARFDALA